MIVLHLSGTSQSTSDRSCPICLASAADNTLRGSSDTQSEQLKIQVVAKTLAKSLVCNNIYFPLHHPQGVQNETIKMQESPDYFSFPEGVTLQKVIEGHPRIRLALE